MAATSVDILIFFKKRFKFPQGDKLMNATCGRLFFTERVHLGSVGIIGLCA